MTVVQPKSVGVQVAMYDWQLHKIQKLEEYLRGVSLPANRSLALRMLMEHVDVDEVIAKISRMVGGEP